MINKHSIIYIASIYKMEISKKIKIEFINNYLILEKPT
jgi:hypothetical protein